MNKNRTIIIVISSIVILGVSYLILSPFLPSKLVPNCQSKSLDYIAKNSQVPLMTPTYLPAGYAYRAGQVIPKSSAPEHIEIDYAPANLPCSETRGTISIQGYNFMGANMTGAQYINQQFNYSKSLYGEGVQRFSLGEGREAYGAPSDTWGNSGASLTIVDDNSKTIYGIGSIDYPLTLEEAVKIGRSLQLVHEN